MKIVVGILACIAVVFFLIVVIFSDDDYDELTKNGFSSCVGSKRSGTMDSSVPEGSYSYPEAHALDHLTSGWRTPDRPDHRGLDIAQGPSTPILAFADGTVAQAGPATGFGQWIVIDHEFGGKKYSTVYGHIFPEDILVETGDEVKAGQHIANQGYNGEVVPPGPQGSHLHFEVWEGGRLSGGHDVDPQPWLNKAVEPSTGKPKTGGNSKIFLIGDSLTEGAKSDLEKVLPDASINAKVGRQFSEGLDILKHTSTRYEVVILALGTNGEFSQDQLDEAIEATHGARVVLTTVAGAKVSSAASVNKLVRKNADKATIADWEKRVKDNSGLIGNDGIHPTTQGRKEFASVLAEAAKNATKTNSTSKEIELPPTSKLKSEEHMQKDAIRVARAAAVKFPKIQSRGGWRPGDSHQDHPEGRAVDLMIPRWDTDEGKKFGDEVLDYFRSNAKQFNIEYFIWRQQFIPAEGDDGYTMNDRGSPTQNHYDHVHITVKGGGYPKEGEKYSLNGEKDSSPTGSTHRTSDCDNDDAPVHVDDDLDATDIPPEYAKWFERSAAQCKQLRAPILAALYHQESGFKQGLVSSTGAQGPGQFMPETWAAWGRKVDDKGNAIGPPGSGDVNDIGDATMASGRFLCSIAEQNEEWKAEGKIHGDDTELMLAGYNAGPGAVLNNGGVPPFEETQHYVKIIPEKAKQFEKKKK